MQRGRYAYTLLRWRERYPACPICAKHAGNLYKMTQQLIDGYEVQWSVSRLDDGKFQVEFTTRALAADRGQTWPVPGGRFFATQDEAERYGKYILLGLRGVDARGQPLFTVV